VNYCYMQTPVGKLLIAGETAIVQKISFAEGKNPLVPEPDWQENPATFQSVVEQLTAYFTGKRRQFGLPMDLQATPFQKKVLIELCNVPYGETISYGELAVKAGNPRAARAAGMANARNPLPVLIPCHRVIGKDGSLTGYGGGLDIKRKLLELEAKHLSSHS